MKHFTWFPLLTLLLTIAACSSPKSLFEDGKYDKAVRKALERIRKDKADDRDLDVLARAFNHLNGQDIGRLETLLADTDPSRWEKIVTLAERIDHRQEGIRPYMPIRWESGKEIQLVQFAVKELLPAARLEAAEWHFREGNNALERARQGNKRAAREAFDRFDRALHYRPGFPGIRERMDEAEFLGLTHLLVQVDNETQMLLPGSFRQLLEETLRRQAGSDWLRITLGDGDCRDCDFLARVRILSVAVSPDGLQENRRTERREIEDGWQYVLDARGNVMKDTAGNDIKVPVIREVSAVVFETRQFKSARMEGSVEIVRGRNGGEVVRRLPVAGESRFLSETVWFEGDERALSDKTRKQLKGHPVPWPSADQLLGDAADLFREEAGRALRRERDVFLE